MKTTITPRSTTFGALRRRSRRYLILLLVAAACSDYSTGPDGEPVGSVSVSPESQELEVGGTFTLTAIAKSAHGQPLSGRTVHWTTDRPGIAIVSPAGVVSAVSAGIAHVTATVEGKQSTAAITVLQTPGPVTRVELNMAAAELDQGAELQLAATALDESSRPVPGVVVAWSSDRPATATVSTTGRVTGVSPGVAQITATVDGHGASAQVTGVGANIMLVDPAGGNPRRLELTSWQRHPSWSPDGRLLAFVSGHETPGAAEEVYTVWADLTRLSVARRTWNGMNHGLPTWIARQ